VHMTVGGDKVRGGRIKTDRRPFRHRPPASDDQRACATPTVSDVVPRTPSNARARRSRGRAPRTQTPHGARPSRSTRRARRVGALSCTCIGKPVTSSESISVSLERPQRPAVQIRAFAALAVNNSLRVGS
jgi:hypothetical protein